MKAEIIEFFTELAKQCKKINKNLILYGDNLTWMKKIPDECIELIYLDPPFKSNKAYNIIYDSDIDKSQVRAFDDTWHWTSETQRTYDQLTMGDHKTTSRIIKTIRSFHDMLGDNDLMAYLVMMTPRLMEMHRILKKTGSIYLHCDPTAAHYLKIIMDTIFDVKNFRAEIIWKTKDQSATIKSNTRSFGTNHNTIFFYSKTDDYFFRRLTRKVKKDPKDFQKDDKGYFKTAPADKEGQYCKETLERMLKEGTAYKTRNGRIRTKSYLKMENNELIDIRVLDNMWTDLPNMMHVPKKERTGYPTQKPEALLNRVIDVSCPKDGVVLDPFCGCGTALISAGKLNRKWIGIDVTYLAVNVLKNRMRGMLGNIEGIDFIEGGAPEGMLSALHMAKYDKKGFEKFIIRKIGGIPNEKLDEGVDGFLFFRDGSKDKEAIVQETVNKSVSPDKVRDFRGTMDRVGAPIGIFITMKEPTSGMIKEANTMGVYVDSFGNEYPRMQFLTVRDIIEEGKKPAVPQVKPYG